MELWIRSQDKTRLTKVNDLYVVGYGNDWAIDGYHTNSVDDFDLGIYSTKERALEVLDEIESLLLPNIKLITRNYTDEEIKECSIKDLVIPPVEDVKIHEFSTYVYQMPKD